MSALRRFARSFLFAGRGVAKTLADERNMRVHFAAALVVLLFNFTVRPRLGLAVLDVAACAGVIAFELMNAAMEHLTDLASKGAWLAQARAAKDAGAAAVLVMAAGAVAIGVYVAVQSWPWHWRVWSATHMGTVVVSGVALAFWLWCVVGALVVRTVADEEKQQQRKRVID